MSDLKNIQIQLRDFANERDWDQFHSPKNLSMALIGEVGELLEHFQWLTEEQSKNLEADAKTEVAEELADIFIYLVRLADKLDIDLVTAAEFKIKKNAIKYPIKKSSGKATKYNKL